MAEARNRAETARRMAADALGRGDPNGWFEDLYTRAARGEAWVPWAEFAPNPHLVSWLTGIGSPAAGRRALVVGCGLGDDAEFLAGRGFAVTAFDVAPTAVEKARARFPGSAVDYTVADVLDPPSQWRGRFDLVAEIYTVQVHRGEARATAIRQIASAVAPGGILLIIARAREADDKSGPMPWPLSLAEISSFGRAGLRAIRVERVDGGPSGALWRAEFHHEPS